MSNISKICIIFMVLISCFFTVPDILDNSVDIPTNISKVKVVIPNMDSYELVQSVEAVLDSKQLNKKEFNFYREYLGELYINKFSISAKGSKKEILNLLGEISDINNISIRDTLLQKDGNEYNLSMDFVFVGNS